MNLEKRIQRIESTLQIQQLPSRYAIAVDSRNLNALVKLFLPDIDCGRWGHGREALKAFYAQALTGFYRSHHQICGHTVDFVDDDTAHGTTYCRAEHEDGDGWYVMSICYFDEYRRCGDQWCFAKRDEQHWYATDITERPNDGSSFQRWPRVSSPRYAPRLPHSWESWNKFWREIDDESIAGVTRKP